MTTFVLKIIALTCMVIDHMGAVFPMYFPVAFRIIGRVAFPIYVYLIADGCRHTRSMPKYLLRLGLFALVSQIPFDMAFNQGYVAALHINFLRDTNVFYTLFLGALSIYFYQKCETASSLARWFIILALPVAMWLAEWLQTDYGGFGVAFIFLMYVIPKKTPRLCVMAVCCCYEFYQVVFGALEKGFGLTFGSESYVPFFNTTGIMMLGACLLSVPLVALYNGRRGPGMKWFFYAVYPAHLFILGCIWLYWVRPILLG